MTTNYSIYLNSPINTKLAVISDFLSLKYTCSVNQVGTMTLELPASTIDPSFLKKDTRLEIWRSVGLSEYLEVKTQWFVRKISYDYDRQIYTLTALSGLCLVDRRIVAYENGVQQTTKKNTPADTAIVDFVEENLGDQTYVPFTGVVGATRDLDRDWSSYISILTSPGNGLTGSYSSSGKPLLQTIQQVAQASTQGGTPLFFDMEYDPGTKLFQFKTFTQQRGIDHSIGQNIVTLSPEFGNLSEVFWEDDYTDEVTYAYAFGKGTGLGINVQTASDTTRIAESPFGRIEAMASGRNSDASAELTSAARALVRNGRPRRIIEAQIVNRPGTEYGVDWGWGDKVKVQVDDQVYTSRLDTVDVEINNGQEKVNAGIRIE